MCIRDSRGGVERIRAAGVDDEIDAFAGQREGAALAQSLACLLYTSDAADERSSVDLGGRRIIKKKNRTLRHETMTRAHKQHNLTIRRTHNHKAYQTP